MSLGDECYKLLYNTLHLNFHGKQRLCDIKDTFLVFFTQRGVQ